MTPELWAQTFKFRVSSLRAVAALDSRGPQAKKPILEVGVATVSFIVPLWDL